MADDEPTFDVVLEDLEPIEVACILNGLSMTMLRAAETGHRAHAIATKNVISQFFREHREVARHLLLESGFGGEAVVGLSDSLEEHLGVRVVDGEVVDAEGMTQIDVEGPDDEIPVRVIDTSPLEDEVELRIRGMRGAVWQLLDVLKHGGESFARQGGEGPIASATITLSVLKQAEPVVSDVENAEDFGTGTAGSLDDDELRELLDVEVEILEEAGDE